eukprot:jgi/Hompol1/2098/HPOL_002046-RA
MSGASISASWSAHLQASLAANSKHITSRWPQLATVTPDGLPAVRTLSYRGILQEYWPERSTNQEAVNSASAGHALQQWMPEQSLTFITDVRSSKVAEIMRNPSVQLCWYMPATREQFRISGTAVVVLPASESIGSDKHHQSPSIAVCRPASSASQRICSLLDGSVTSGTALLPSERLRSAIWRRLSSGARAQFLWPLAKGNAPGTPKNAVLELSLPDANSEQDTHLEQLNREALANFAVLLVVPSRIEVVDLFVQPFGETVWDSSL